MPNKKINICFVLPDLNRGGAQRIMNYVASNLDQSTFHCTLLIVGPPKNTDFKVNGIKLRHLNKKRLLYASFSLFYILASNRYDIVIGSIGHINKILGFYSILIKKTKFIGREASLDTIIEKYNKSKSLLIGRILNDYRNRFDALICQSNDMEVNAIRAYNLNPDKVFTINNPLTILPPNSFPNTPSSYVKQLITIGRLSEEKGHKRIISILSKIVDIKWHYTIVGDGIEKNNIQNLIKSLNLEQQVTLIPHLNNVNEILINSDLFLQGSFVEGFPNATLESCLFGTPVIAFNAPGGTKEIIKNDVNGYIASSEDEYIKFIRIALADKLWNRREVSNSVSDKFNSQFIILKYQSLFIKILNR